MTQSNYKILTPHAAVIVWNYNDRISGDVNGVIDEEGITQPLLISTVSCLSIETNKTKSNPAGSFQLVLAPTKNWISTITTGSWCAILMSNKPITADSVKTADPEQIKMFGKIETVRIDVTVNQEGARQTRFLVSGTDWGHIFNNVLYIDPYIQEAGRPKNLGTGAAVAIMKMFTGGTLKEIKPFTTRALLSKLLNLFGNNLEGFDKLGTTVNRLAKSNYDFEMPEEVTKFFQFVKPFKKGKDSRIITRLLTLQTGKLVGDNKYKPLDESFGIVSPNSLIGSFTFWQLLLENSNQALNELYNEIDWSSGKPQLTLYNRIKPFSYRTNVPANSTRSPFKFVKTHTIDLVTVLAINTGTNWRDKVNFIEVKPQDSSYAVMDNWTKTKSQIFDAAAFNREGFRPLIVTTKQNPNNPLAKEGVNLAPQQLTPWTQLMSEWFFDTHRLLNGTLTITGQNEYIAVGNNIIFNASLINPTPNINKENANHPEIKQFILAHVEGINHSFSVDNNGARQYITTIQFVRGITVKENKDLAGEGSLDQFAESITADKKENSLNVVTSSDKDNPGNE